MSGVNVDLFIKNFTNESVYLLGFLWADGYISNKQTSNLNRVSTQFLSSDFGIISDVFAKTGKWSIFTRNRLNQKPTTIVTTCNKNLHKFLTEMKYTPKSNYSPDKILSTIPNNLVYLWWRGYFDGDGCIYINKNYSTHHLTFSSSYEQDWTFIHNMCKKLNLKYYINYVKRKHKSSVVRITNKKDISIFFNYIYPKNYDFGFKRKYSKFKEIKFKT